jgi:hypothetical protein
MTPLLLSESSFHNEHREKNTVNRACYAKIKQPTPCVVAETGQHQANNMAVETRHGRHDPRRQGALHQACALTSGASRASRANNFAKVRDMLGQEARGIAQIARDIGLTR